MVIIKRKKTVAELKAEYADVTARTALVRLLQYHKMYHKNFMWFGKMHRVGTALQEIPHYLLDMPANSFGMVRFFGGPVGQARWFDGTVLTMLIDVELFEMHSQGSFGEKLHQ